MNMIYNSDNFCVVEFLAGEAPAQVMEQFAGGFEIVDKLARRELFIDGTMAQTFRERVSALIEGGASTTDDFDTLLDGFTALMQHPVVLH